MVSLHARDPAHLTQMLPKEYLDKELSSQVAGHKRRREAEEQDARPVVGEIVAEQGTLQEDELELEVDPGKRDKKLNS